MITLFASLGLLGTLQGDLLPAPMLTRIVVQPDTVWFAGPVYHENRVDTIAYALVRRTGQWLRVGRRSFPPLPKLVPENQSDTVPLIPGFALTARRVVTARDSNALQLGVTSIADRTFHPLVPVLTTGEAEHLKPPEGLWYGTDMDARIEDLPLAEPNGVWTADSAGVWFGLAGGFSEGEGGVGGLLRFDRRRRAVESVWHDQLLQVTVSSLSIAGGGVWVGTLHNGEYGPGGWVGLLRYDLRTREWLRYQADSTPLPGNAIWGTATDGRRLWVSTDRGLAEIHLRTGRWRVAYFEAALRGDSIVHELAGRGPSPVIEKTLTLVRRLDTPRRPEFLEALRRLPTQRFACEMDMEDCQAEALAAQPLVPFLLEALNGSGGDIAAKALERLGDRSTIPSLRKALDTAQPLRVPTIALALAHMGDSAGPAWFRRRLLQRPLGPYGSLVMQLAAELRDSSNIPALIELLHSRDDGQSAMSVIKSFRSPDLWRRAATSVIGDSTAMAHFLLSAQYSDAPFNDPDFRRNFDRIVADALQSRSPQLQTLAVRNLLLQHNPVGIPHLIRLITEDQFWMPIGEKLRLLVEATGVDSVPFSPYMNPNWGNPEIPKAQAFWGSWWEESRTRFRFATEEEGRAALRRWRERWPEEDH